MKPPIKDTEYMPALLLALELIMIVPAVTIKEMKAGSGAALAWAE